MNEKLKTQINKALKDFEANPDPKWSDEFKTIVLARVRKSVETLMDLAEEIRKLYPRTLGKHTTRRSAEFLMAELLGQGQAITGLMFRLSLRSSITDPIEHHYGINFSGLRAYRVARHNIENYEVYVAFYIPTYDSVTLMRNGECFALPTSEFQSNYTILTYHE